VRTRNLVVTALLLPLMLASGCVTARVPHTGLKVPVPSLSFIGLPWPGLGEGNLSRMPWDNAFIAMKGRMQREYPFTAWKAIDWPALEAQYLPLINAAQQKQDAEAYYLALRSFLYAIPDGHIGISDHAGYRHRAIGGGLGFAVHRMDDGRVIVHVLDEQGPAAKAGLRWGAEILGWNGRPLAEAVATVPVLWAPTPPATAYERTREQYKLLTRMPVGTSVSLSYRNEGVELPAEATLVAYDDAYASLDHANRFEKPLDDNGSPFDFATLTGNIGYVRIRAVGPTLSVPFPDRAFAAALQGFLDANVPGLIMDLRRNSGGSNELAAKLCGHFFTQDQHFQDMATFDPKLNTFVLRDDLALRVAPSAPHFDRPIIVLIDSTTMDAGEGIALLLKRLPNVRTLGIEPTHGTFALLGGGMQMPTDHTIFYPVGRAMDAAGNILLESNAQGVGGITPDIPVPITRDVLHRRFVQVENIVQEQARLLLLSEAKP